LLKVGSARDTLVSKNMILRKTRLKFKVLKNGNLLFNQRYLDHIIDLPNEDSLLKILIKKKKNLQDIIIP